MSIAERGFLTDDRIEARAGNRRGFASRDIVCRQGDPVGQIYRIEHGTVMLYQILRDGRRQIVDVICAGEYFGFGDGSVQDCFAETLTNCEVTAWRIDDAQKCVVWRDAFSRAMQRKLGAMHDHTRSTSYSSASVNGRVTVPSRKEPCGEIAGSYSAMVDSGRSSQ